MATAAVTPFELEGAYIPQQTITIASVYPIDLVTDISRRAPKSKFVVPAGTKDKPGILPVEDTWEGEYTDARGHRNIRILAEHTARHIVEGLTIHVFESSAADQAFPGVFICAGSQPTAEEINTALECQRRYWVRLVNSARAKARDKRMQDIQDKERMAAKELGLSGEEWMLEISRDSMKKCVWCAEFIPGEAKKCPKAGCGGFQKPEYATEFAEGNASAGRRAVPDAAPAQAPLKPPTSNQANQQART